MTISSELKSLDELRRNGVLSTEEFELAKKKVLEGSQDIGSSDHLEVIKTQNEIAQLDREWELERDSYMITGQHGHKHIPGKVSSVFMGLFIVGFGIVWTGIALFITKSSGVGIFSIFPVFGVLFVLFGAGMSIRSFMKANQYEEAQKRYERQRELLTRNQKI